MEAGRQKERKSLLPFTIRLSVRLSVFRGLVAIANALQLEAARAKPTNSRFNYDAMPNLKSLSLSIAVLQRFCC